MKKAIIIGASSGIGRELAVVLSKDGYTLGLAARRVQLLEELKSALAGPAYCRYMDVSDPAASMDSLVRLIEEMGETDLIVISAGTGSLNPALEWMDEKKTIDTNVIGFAATANIAYRYFEKRGRGHLVGISSVAALRGGRQAPAYNASKAFVSNYLEGLRSRANKADLPITITEIRPGFVDTRMARGEGIFWMASPRKAAEQTYGAIRRKAKRAYVTKRWSLIGFLLAIMPDFLFEKL
jgi:short-subunit dehydrogenase